MHTTETITHTKTNIVTAVIAAAAFVAAAAAIVVSQECDTNSLTCLLPRTTVKLTVEQESNTDSTIEATATISKQRRAITSACYGQEWDWGDGTKTSSMPLCAKNSKGSAATKTVTEAHTYSDSGTFAVRLSLISGNKTVAESNDVFVTVQQKERRIQ